ncbi:MAG: TasA family protein [Actinomycetota bacterium]
MLTSGITGDRAPKRNTFTKILASLAVLALAGGTFTVASLALFTGQDTVGANSFGTGTVDITAAPATALVTASNMSAGDQVTAPLTITNSGTLEHRYAITSTTDEDVLAPQLVLTIKAGVTTCDDANWTTDGSVLFQGILGSTGTTAVVGDNTSGADSGDRVLAAAANEELCFNVTLPLATGNSAEGLTSTATFTFDAEQTANNP